jgi:hypothetical protein
MSSQISNAILTAIDILTDKKISEAGYDKTYVAKFISRDAASKECLLECQGVEIKALSESDYKQDDLVYVTIPQNDLTKLGTVIGKATADSSLAPEIISQTEEDSFDRIGRTFMQDDEAIIPVKDENDNIVSYSYFLYQINGNNNINYDEASFKGALRHSTHILVKTKFTTNFTNFPQVYEYDFGIKIKGHYNGNQSFEYVLN